MLPLFLPVSSLTVDLPSQLGCGPWTVDGGLSLRLRIIDSRLTISVPPYTLYLLPFTFLHNQAVVHGLSTVDCLHDSGLSIHVHLIPYTLYPHSQLGRGPWTVDGGMSPRLRIIDSRLTISVPPYTLYRIPSTLYLPSQLGRGPWTVDRGLSSRLRIIYSRSTITISVPPYTLYLPTLHLFLLLITYYLSLTT